ALAAEPKLLLLDEPFGALDAKVRQELRSWLRRLHEEIHVTSIFVTHDQEEAFEVADRVVVMNKGRIEQIGSPQDVFEHPATPFVMDFLGNVNVFHGRVEAGRAHVGGMSVDWPAHASEDARAATAYVRPHELDVLRSRSDASGIEALVVRVHAVGPVVRVLLEDARGEVLLVDLSRDRAEELALSAGETVWVAPRKVRVFVHDAPGVQDFQI
ncbi:MAG: sulfate/molybdate ABC transporter ATP-binding protein, partial [Alphaproteobacteria bacterium]